MKKRSENSTRDFPEGVWVPAPHQNESEKAERDARATEASVGQPKSYLTLDPPPPQGR